MIERYAFLSVYLDFISRENVVNCVELFIKQQRAARIYFLNAHCYNVATTDTTYRSALRAAEMLLPDGVGMLWATKILGLPHKENLNGSDLVPRLCLDLVKRRNSLRVFILGGQPGVAVTAGQNLANQVPGLEIVGTQHGYFASSDNSEVIARINAANPDIVLVGMGVPLQEIWIDQHVAELKVGAIFGVGGLLDFLSGRIERAPLPIRKSGLEWAWRLTKEPARLWQRYIVGNPLFVSRVLAWRWARVEPAPSFTLNTAMLEQIAIKRHLSELPNFKLAADLFEQPRIEVNVEQI